MTFSIDTLTQQLLLCFCQVLPSFHLGHGQALQLLIKFLLPFLCTGTILPLFQIGKY